MNRKPKKSLRMPSSRIYPDPFAPIEEKRSEEYGLQFGRLISYEWFSNENGSTVSQYFDKRLLFDTMRRYARGEHDTGLTKKLLTGGVDGETYTNYDWRPIQLLPKFLKLVVNKALDRLFDIDAEAVDSVSQAAKDAHRGRLLRNFYAKELFEDAKKLMGIRMVPETEMVPDSIEELELHMKLEYKLLVEIAVELALKYTLEYNDYDEVQRMVLRDLTEIGVAFVHHGTDPRKGIQVKYVDPADMVWSYSAHPDFKKVYYYGQVERMTLHEVQRLAGRKFTAEELESYKNVSNEWQGYNRISNEFWYRGEDLPSYMVDVLHFTFKTTKVVKYKKKYRKNGSFSISEKSSDFIKTPEQLQKEQAQGFPDFDILEDVRDVWFEGSMILGSDMLFNYHECVNLIRPEGHLDGEALPPFIGYAPEIYQGRIQSLVGRVRQTVDELQQTKIKIQQFIAKAKPNGIWIDVDGLMELDLGDGQVFSVLDLVKYYDDTGNVLGTSRLSDGGYNPGSLPIKELNNGQIAGLEQLMNAYNFQLMQFRDAIGISEGVDGRMPHPDTPVGIQQQLEASSSTVTQYLLDAQLKITQKLAEAITLRLKDLFEFSNLKDAYTNAIGKMNMAVVESLNDISLRDLGIKIKLKPSAQERAMLEQNIQNEIAKGTLTTSDAIDLRKISNLSLANEMLKLRRKKNDEAMHKRKLEEIQATGQANSQAAQLQSQARAQEMQMKYEGESQLLMLQRENELARIKAELEAKKELLILEKTYDMGIEQIKVDALSGLEKEKEDRKDKRTAIQAKQQSKMIDQRTRDTGPTDFEKEHEEKTGQFDFSEFKV